MSKSPTTPTVATAARGGMLPPAEALAIVLRHVRPLATETVALADAGGRILAADLIATEDHPPFAAATMDGFAVVAEDSSPWREVLGEQMAGTPIDIEVSHGAAVRIMTGAPLPRGADAVVPIEETEPTEDHVIIHQEDVKPGQNIRPVGVDLRRGESVIPAGTPLGPAEIGLVAGLGVAPVTVYRRPRVSILSTGDELVEPGQPVGPGQIRDSNRFSLIAAVHATGAELVWAGTSKDEKEQLGTRMRELIGKSDVVLTSGGVSMGDLDLVKALLGELAEVHFQRLFMKPGKPLNFATAGDVLLFGLAGNPVSTIVGFELFVRPALAGLSGRAVHGWQTVPVTLTERAKPSDRIEYQRGIVEVDPGGRLLAHNTGSQASSRLASFIGANALLIIPPRATVYDAGEQIEAILLAPPQASSAGTDR